MATATDLAFDVLGDDHAPVVVLLHGFPLDRRVLRPMAEGLASDCRVVTIDLPGFGGSGPTAAFSISDLARRVRAMLMSRGLLPCVLGGLSMGGYVSLAYHRLFREDLRGLVLLDTKAEADTPEARANRDRMAAIARREGPGAIAALMFPKMLAPGHSGSDHPLARRLMEIMAACPAETMAQALLAMRDRDDFTADLARSDVPVMVVAGEHDAITPPGPAEALAGLCRRGQFRRIADAGHMAPLEQPAAVAEAVLAFVRSLRPAG